MTTTLVAAPTDQNDDFSWEDEDEDASPKADASPTPNAAVLNRERLLSVTDASGTMSPQRSDDSFDIVSSGHTSATGDSSAAHVNEGGTSEGDEDEEEEEEDEEEEEEDEDEDEDEAESDWE
jgi:hypothetical protein